MKCDEFPFCGHTVGQCPGNATNCEGCGKSFLPTSEGEEFCLRCIAQYEMDLAREREFDSEPHEPDPLDDLAQTLVGILPRKTPLGEYIQVRFFDSERKLFHKIEYYDLTDVIDKIALNVNDCFFYEWGRINGNKFDRERNGQ